MIYIAFENLAIGPNSIWHPSQIRRWATYGYHAHPPHLNETIFFAAPGYTEHEFDC